MIDHILHVDTYFVPVQCEMNGSKLVHYFLYCFVSSDCVANRVEGSFADGICDARLSDWVRLLRLGRGQVPWRHYLRLDVWLSNLAVGLLHEERTINDLI